MKLMSKYSKLLGEEKKSRSTLLQHLLPALSAFEPSRKIKLVTTGEEIMIT
jgi:hypothetical protein